MGGLRWEGLVNLVGLMEGLDLLGRLRPMPVNLGMTTQNTRRFAAKELYTRGPRAPKSGVCLSAVVWTGSHGIIDLQVRC